MIPNSSNATASLKWGVQILRCMPSGFWTKFSTHGLHQYDMILGHDIMSELRSTLNFKDQTRTWDDLTIDMKDPESLPDLLDPVNDFFWSNNHYETEALQEASAHLQKILDAKYAPADLNAVVQACRHLMEDEKSQLHAFTLQIQTSI